MQDMRLDVRKQQDSVDKLSRDVARVVHGGGGETPSVPTPSARQKMEATNVDSVEDLGRLLAENADLDRLVTKVREAQQQLHVDGTVRLLREEENSFREMSTSAPSTAGRRNSFGARLRRGGRRFSCKALTLHPAGGVRIAWDALQLLLLCFSLLSLPVVLGFEDVLSAADVRGLRAANAAVDVLLLVDVLLNFRVAVISSDGLLVRGARTIAHHYVEGALLRDLLGACPLSLAHATGAARIPSWLPLLFGAARAARTRRLVISVAELSPLTAARARASPALLRLGQLVSLYLLVCHWVACCWQGIARGGGDAEDAAAAAATAIAALEAAGSAGEPGLLYGGNAEGLLWGPSAAQRGWCFARQYGFSFYWAVGLLTGIVPRDISPDTILEIAFTVGSMLVGVAMLALVVSSATSALHSVDAVAEAQRRELELINGFLDFKRVPHDLRRRINSFYHYLFGAAQVRNLDRSSAIHSLPPQLHMQLLVAINMRTLSNVPLFKHCDIRTMISIVERMQSAIYCPGEMMVREGTPGKAIFLINHGTAHVLKGGQVVVVLSDHEFFGEQSIITDVLCTASVRAITYR